MAMKNLVICLVMLLACASGAYAQRDRTNFSMTKYDVDLISKTDLPVMIAEVVSVPNQAWTNGNPPKVTLRMINLLRGRDYPRNMIAIWQPMPYDTSWAEADETTVSDEWKALPLQAPRRDSRWMLTGKWDNNSKLFYVSPVARFPESGDAFTVLTRIIQNNIKNRVFVDEKPIIEEAARAARIEQWANEMKQSNAAALAAKSAVVAEVQINEMQSAERMVQFTVTNLIKIDSPVTATSIKLAGLPNKLYSVLHDYKQSRDLTSPTFLVFMNTSGSAYVPIDVDYSIQPASVEALRALGITKKN